MTKRTTKRMSTVDGAFLALDSAEVSAHVAVLTEFTLPADAPPDFLKNLVADLQSARTFRPPFNYRPASSPLRKIAPSWEVLADDEIDLDYHFRHSALPSPGGERELGVLVSRLHSRHLDPTKPLWEMHLIEGLEDDRFAIYFKVHHAYFDGVGGSRRFAMMFDTDPTAEAVRPVWAIDAGSRRTPKPKTPAGERVRNALSGAREGALVMSDLGKAAGGLIKEAARPTDESLAVPFKVPATPRLNGRIGRQRRFATQVYDFDRIRDISKRAGVTINDVFVTIAAGGLRRYLEDLGELPDESLVAGAPVSVRVQNDDESANALTFIMLKMFTDIAEPVERLKAVNRSSNLAKANLKALRKGAAEQYGLLTNAPIIVQTMLGLAGRLPVPYNLVLSNVPGPRAPLYLRGARMDALFPVSVVMHAQALVIVCVTTGDKFNVGIVGDRDLLPHLQHLAVHMGDSLAELEAALDV